MDERNKKETVAWGLWGGVGGRGLGWGWGGGEGENEDSTRKKDVTEYMGILQRRKTVRERKMSQKLLGYFKEKVSTHEKERGK